jgi:tetratricopeptide (TPR) repeat protein
MTNKISGNIKNYCILARSLDHIAMGTRMGISMSTLGRFIFLVGIASLLAACQSGGGQETVVQPVATVAAPTAGLQPRERFSLALRLLEKGDASQARAELESYLGTYPESKPGKLLIDQIDSPIAEYFPSENFAVDLGTGETLSTLAKTYLGDALKFYGLARYNGISNPSRVTIGQAIRIPATPEALAAQARGPVDTPEETKSAEVPSVLAPDPTLVESDPVVKAVGWDEIQLDIAKGRNAAAIEKMDEIGWRDDSDGGHQQLAATAFKAEAAAQETKSGILAATYYGNASYLFVKLGKPDEALQAATRASELNPGDKEIQNILASAKQASAEDHYRMGSTSFQKQELDAAIAHWDEVLKIDPKHSNAQLRRAQALELKEKLSKLSKKP